MSILELQKVLVKPSRPHCAVSDETEWRNLEKQHQIAFPGDFKDFIGVYGTGTLFNFVSIFNPFSNNKFSNFFHNMEFVLSIERRFQDIPLPLYPETSGILPFAKTYDGDNLWWQMVGMPDEWPVIVTRAKSGYYETYPMPMSMLFTNLIVENPDPQKDIMRNSHILNDMERKAPFESRWIVLEKSLQNFKIRLADTSTQANKEVNRSKLEELLRYHGLELETEFVKQQLEAWQQEGFIELLKGDEVYLRVLGET